MASLFPAFAIAIPAYVSYTRNTRTLRYSVPDADFCLRVDVSTDGGLDWTNYAGCVTSTDGVLTIVWIESVTDVRVAVCLRRRNDVCSDEEIAIIGKFKFLSFLVGILYFGFS